MTGDMIFVVPSLDTSAFITSYAYYRALRSDYSIQFLGLSKTEKQFLSVSSPVDYTLVGGSFSIMMSIPILLVKLLTKKYDAIVSFKLLPQSIIPSAIASRIRKKPLVVVIDDYDKAHTKNPVKRLVLSISERFLPKGSIRFVSTTKLKEVYGGDIVMQNVANEKKERTVLYAGSLYPHKGIHTLIEAVQLLENTKLFIFGSGDEKYVKMLKELAGEETFFAGQAPKEVVDFFTEHCDVYVIPTLPTMYSEAQIPAKVFEPMAYGKPIVATDVGDNRKIIGDAGLLVSPDNISELSKAIGKILSDKKLASELGRKAKERYNRKYSQKVMDEKIRELVKQKLGA